MGRKKKQPHWRDAARAALETKAREGDPKAIRLLETSFGEAQAEGRGDSRQVQELRAILAMTMPGWASIDNLPADPDELRAFAEVVINRVLYLEEQARELADLRTWVEILDEHIRFRCTKCGTIPWHPLAPGTDRGDLFARWKARRRSDADADAEVGQASPPIGANAAYRCPQCGAEHVQPAGQVGWTCRCGQRVATPFRTF